MGPADNEVCVPRLTAGWDSRHLRSPVASRKGVGFYPGVGKSEYHLRVAQENVTFALIGRGKSTAGLFHNRHDDHLVRQFSGERLASTRIDKGANGVQVDARDPDYMHGIAVAQFCA